MNFGDSIISEFNRDAGVQNSRKKIRMSLKKFREQRAEAKKKFREQRAEAKNRLVERARNVSSGYNTDIQKVVKRYGDDNRFSTGSGQAPVRISGQDIMPEFEDKGIQKRPSIKPFYAPETTEIDSMDGIYRPFTLGENGNRLNDRRTMFDGDEDFNREKRKSLWLRMDR